MNAQPSSPRWPAVLAAMAWMLAAGAAHAQTVYPHPNPATGQTSYPLFQAYGVGPVQENSVFHGERRGRQPDVVLGKLDLASRTDGGGNVIVDLQAFATFRAGAEHSPVPVVVTDPADPSRILYPKLTLTIAPSARYPAVYPDDADPAISGQRFTQFGTAGIRTHWLLAGMPPGTRFVLENMVECTQNGTGAKVRHIDQWTWTVRASLDSLRAALEMLHSIPVGTIGIPPIASETAYARISSLVDQIRAAINSRNLSGANALIAQLFSALASYDAANQILSTQDGTGLLGYEAFGVTLEEIDRMY